MGKITTAVFICVSLSSAFVSYEIFKDQDAPETTYLYWGPSSTTPHESEDYSIRPYKVNISNEVLSDLKSRLKLELTTGNRLTKPYEGIGFEYGFNTDYLKTVGQYWLDNYDWKQREKLINKYPHFMTQITGLDIHFQHVKSSNNHNSNSTIPLLLLHGWPGSFTEFQKIIPMLMDPKDSEINFELVIPSLPGFGFSEGATRPGLGASEMAQLFVMLMQRLGHEHFYVQGGDWGSVVASSMATLYPKNVKGLHINYCLTDHPRVLLRRIIASFYPQMFMDADEEAEYYPTLKYLRVLIEENGYTNLHWSKPDTVGVALSNSPLGLAAYILEKFAIFTDRSQMSKTDGGLSTFNDMDNLLDNLMIYWVTHTITTSVRIYSEISSPSMQKLSSVPVKVPTACYAPKNEIFDQPEYFLHDKYPQLVSYTKAKFGGHFVALEAPEELSKDVIQFISRVEKSIQPIQYNHSIYTS